MRLVLFTKDHDFYLPFIGECINKFDQVLIVTSDRNEPEIQGISCIFHGFKNDKEYPQLVKQINDFNADILISFYYDRIIQGEILHIPNLAVNFHGSLLPNYAGAHALNWQIINGEKQSGVTIHELTNTVDGGRIISQESFQIEFEDTANDVLRKGIHCSTKMLTRLIEDYKSGMIRMYQQISSGSEFSCTKRKAEDGEITKDMNHISAYNMIRALVSPWPGAFYYNDDGNRVVLGEYLTLEEVKEIL